MTTDAQREADAAASALILTFQEELGQIASRATREIDGKFAIVASVEGLLLSLLAQAATGTLAAVFVAVPEADLPDESETKRMVQRCQPGLGEFVVALLSEDGDGLREHCYRIYRALAVNPAAVQ